MTTNLDPTTFPSLFSPAVEDSTRDQVVASAPAGDEIDRDPETPSFSDLGLPHRLLRALAKEGITTPFEIQTATIPDVLSGRDVLGRGQTGSGKTLAFGLPLLVRMSAGTRPRSGQPRALILVPTRELAMQVADALRPLARAVEVTLTTAVGGVPYERQVDALRRGVHVMIATPGRLGDLIERGNCDLGEIEMTVLDEADQMADMGFLPDVSALLDKTPGDGQRLLFSATLDSDVDKLVRRFLTDPVTHSTAPPVATVSTMDHHLLLIPPTDKFRVTAAIAAREGRTIMFARTQAGVDRLVTQLAAVGVRAGALHGGKTQRVRTRTLAEFREGRIGVLVATDVAARGIHVDDVSLVVHVDPPKDSKDYLHRAGRTARAGESGAVATLVLPKQRKPTLAMMLRAGVEPEQNRVRAGDPALSELTGAREPSGVPVPPDPEPVRRGEGRSDGRRGPSRWRGEARHRPGAAGEGGGPTRAARGRGGVFADRQRAPQPGPGQPRTGAGPRGERPGRPERPHAEHGWADRGRADRVRGERGRTDRTWGERARPERDARPVR